MRKIIQELLSQQPLFRASLFPCSLQEGDTLEELSRIQQSSVGLLLALLGNTTGDLALCHNSLQFCCQLFESSNILATVMVDAGLIEVLCSMILKLFDSNTR